MKHSYSVPTLRMLCALSVRFIFIFISSLLVGGCDMPDSEPTLPQVPLKITYGPYLTNQQPGQVTICFRTNRPCVAGLRIPGQTKTRTARFASGDNNHRVIVHGLSVDKVTKSEIFLDDKKSFILHLRGGVGAGAPTMLAFLGGGGEAKLLTRAADRISSLDPDRLIIAGAQFPQSVQEERWLNGFFQPLKSVANLAPLVFAPGALRDVPNGIFPSAPTTPVWRQQIGCVEIIGLRTEALLSRASRVKVLAQLDQEMQRTDPAAVWRVLLLSKPIFSARGIHARALQLLGATLQKHKIQLVFSGSPQPSAHYHRTLPLTAGGQGRVRHIVLAGLHTADTPLTPRMAYTASTTATPHYGILQADEGALIWKLYSLSGQTLDMVTLTRGHEADTPEASRDQRALLTTALGRLALQRELAALARQACRAVPTPNGKSVLPIRIMNPSNHRFVGELRWRMPENPSHQIGPPYIAFDLKPGGLTTTGFRIIALPQSKGSEPPVLEVRAKGIGYASQPLILTQQKTITVPPVSGVGAIDGKFNESFWKQAVELKGFTTIRTGAAPARVLRAWAAYSPAGFHLAIRAEAKKPSSIRTSIKTHDGPVYEDESVEIFIDPQGTGRDYLQLAINVRGQTLDRSSRTGLRWNPPWQHAVRFDRTRGDKAKEWFDTEILIPYRSLGLNAPPKPGHRWALNITRNDYAKQRRYKAKKAKAARRRKAFNQPPPNPGFEVVQWASTFGSNGRSGLYRVIIFAENQAKPMAER